ncbi:hypothetical protein EZ428_20265 [Pedobacter frigiditerrae]|uniref:Uncharacterized protein n=1 Tax=Pedobacter frigiditerrae TaxID=2530452 RepID=A0A4R0MMW1_9SPHI|nr:hypothetical protein [Pedobacter frigiditerrae]TCC88060.1 hypothetical protein EZ428_20265 [Pedobacter frigiditerrae]
MDPFNIVIRRAGKQIGLNIHPKDDVGYMVLFEGSLVGEVFLDDTGKVWGALTARELLAGTYPNYPCDESVDCEGLLQEQEMITMIGHAIATTMGMSAAN